jgi:multidrug efflux pump subunit AcrA (membrane-fusion protein)
MKRLFIITLLITINTYAEDVKIVFAKKIEKTEIFDRYYLPAKIQSKVEAMVLAENSGRVEEIKVNLGQVIEKKATLVSIKHTDPSYKYNALKVSSPVAGIVADIYVSEGSLVAQGASLVRVIDPTKVKILVELTPRQLQVLKIGDAGELSAAVNEKKFKVVIKGVSPIIDSLTGTAPAELEIVDEKNISLISLGTVGKVQFKANLHQGINLPEYAIAYDGTKPQLRIIEKDKVVIRDIKLGLKRDDQVEISEGLKGDEVVVLRSNSFLKPGDKVQVQK